MGSNQTIQDAVLVTKATPTSGQTPVQFALFSTAGLPLRVLQPAAAQPDSVAATVGALVTDFNGLLAKLRAAGHLL